MTLARPFSFTKDCQTMRIDNAVWKIEDRLFETMLFDLANEPGQQMPVSDPGAQQRLRAALVDHMHACDAPQEHYQRLGLD